MGLASSNRRPATATVRAANARSSASDPNPVLDPLFGAAGAQHERLLVAIDQQLLHIRMGQIPLQGSQPQQGVEHRLAKALAGPVVQGDAAGQDVFAVGVGQLLGDHRPHQRLIILRRGEEPGRPNRRASSAAAAPRTLATSPSSAEDCP